MGVLEPARCSYEGWPAIKGPNTNRDRWDGNLFFLKIYSLKLFSFYFSYCIICILDVMCLLCYILMMLLIHYYIDAIPRALYTSIFVLLCSALVKRLQIQLLFLHINQQSVLCNNYTCNCLYIHAIMREKQLLFAAILVQHHTVWAVLWREQLGLPQRTKNWLHSLAFPVIWLSLSLSLLK